MPPKGSRKGKKKAPTSVSPSDLQNGLDLNAEANGIMSEESKTKTKDKSNKNVTVNDELMEPVIVTEVAPDEKNDTDEISEENSTKALEKKGKRPANEFSTKKEIDTKVYNYLDSLEKSPAKKPRGRPKRKGVKEEAKSQEEENESLSEEERDQEELVNTEKSISTRGRKTAVKKVVEPKNQKAENVEEPKKDVAKGKRKYNSEEESSEKLKSEDFENAKNVRVSIVRSPDIDDLALKLQESDNTKVKAAAGTSGKGRGRKRVAEDTSSGSEPKKDKTEGSKRSQRAKIPDVSALDFDNKSTNAQGKSWNLKIATWNVNGIRAWIEKDGLSYLHHENPDILCLQETKCSEEKIPEECNPLGYHCYWLGGDKEGYSGVGLMSKEKPESVEYGIGKKTHDNEGRVITAEYEKFYLVATYVPNAGRKLVRLDYRKQWDIDFKAYLKKLDKIKPIVLCGDLNVAHNEIDLANPKTNKKNAGFTQEERDGFSAILSEGFIDAFRHLYPDTKDAYTFWTYMMNARAKNVGWRLDYFVLSKIFVDNLCDCVIRRDVMGSDHCPLVLFLHI